MLKKYVAKFTVDILPSVAATVIGAYIVNHYIVTSRPEPRSPRRYRPDPCRDPAPRPLPRQTLPSSDTSSDAAMPGSRA